MRNIRFVILMLTNLTAITKDGKKPGTGSPDIIQMGL